MKLYGMSKRAPNPRRVRIFLAEKGIPLEEMQVDLAAGEHKSRAFLQKNPLGQIPVLELDDGETISESLAICRYLEALHPDPPLFGAAPLEQARVEMWTRRVELELLAPLRNFFQHAHPYTAASGRQFREFGESRLEIYTRAQRWFDGEMAERDFVAGDRFSVADICLLCALDFGTIIGAPLASDCPTLLEWRDRVGSRPSARA